jgi:hypothetical protein
MPPLYSSSSRPIDFIRAPGEIAGNHDQLVCRLSPHAAAPHFEPRSRVRCPLAGPVAVARRDSVGDPYCSANLVWHTHMAQPRAMIARSVVANLRFNPGVVARLLEYVPHLLAPRWSILRLSETKPETVVAHHGAVEIRQPDGGFSLQTRVKGELDQARATALRRLASYLKGTNRSAMQIRAAGPLTQSEESPGRWLVGVGLSGVGDTFAATVSRGGRVQICSAPPATVAVLCMAGRPKRDAIILGEAVIRATLGDTVWVPTGGPIIRMHRAPAVLSPANRFEIALPIALRGHNGSRQAEAG